MHHAFAGPLQQYSSYYKVEMSRRTSYYVIRVKQPLLSRNKQLFALQSKFLKAFFIFFNVKQECCE